MANLQHRLEVLEGQLPAPEPPDRTEVRKRIKENLDRIAALRRGELEPEEAAEVRANLEALQKKIEERRNRGVVR